MPGGHSLFGTRAIGSQSPPIDPLGVSGLLWYVQANRSMLLDGSGNPAAPGLAVQTCKDLGPNHLDLTTTPFAAAGQRPTLVAGGSPAGHNTLRFVAASKSLMCFAGGGGLIGGVGNGAGYTFYAYYNCRSLNTGAVPGQYVLYLNFGGGFTWDQQFPNGGPPSVTVAGFSPGSFGFQFSAIGWQLWDFVANPTPSTGATPGNIHFYRDSVKVGPTSGTGGPVIDNQVWDITCKDGLFVGGDNVADNSPFDGDLSALILYSGAHSDRTRKGIERWLRANA